MKTNPQFEAAVQKIFQHWDVLHHAVASQFGGQYSREKADWLPSVVYDFFLKNHDLDPSEIETFVGEIMDNEFDLLVEDGSLKKLSKQLCRCFALARDRRDQELNDFLSKLQPLPPPREKKIENEDDDEDEDEEGEESDEEKEEKEANEATSSKNETEIKKDTKPKNIPVVDEDGFTLVVGKKKR